MGYVRRVKLPPAKEVLVRCKKYLWVNHICFGNVLTTSLDGVLHVCHDSPVGGHHSGVHTAAKVLQVVITGHCSTWMCTNLPRNALSVKSKRGGVSKRQKLPLTPILEVQLFDILSTDL